MNILLSAFRCEPNKGSEPGVGWNWAVNLSKFNNVYVITRGDKKTCIEDYLKKNQINNIHFSFYEEKGIWSIIDKHVPYGYYLYYRHWQKKIVVLAKKVLADCNIDIIHHITYNEFRTPGKLYTLGVPFVWGPIGGGHSYKKELRDAYFRRRDVFLECIRNKLNNHYLKTKDFISVINIASCILVADPETYKMMPKTRSYVRLLETAYYPERNDIKNYINISEYRKIELLYVGVLQPRKGLKLLIDALGESNFRNFHLNIIGSGKDGNLLKKNVSKYEIKNNVSFIGQVTYDEANSYYDKADLFVFPSLRDTSGNVVLEAMSHGVPVITLNHNGASEIVTGECGELIEIYNYKQVKEDFVSAIRKYDTDRVLIQKKGIAARARIENNYSWDHTMDAVRAVYSEIYADK